MTSKPLSISRHTDLLQQYRDTLSGIVCSICFKLPRDTFSRLERDAPRARMGSVRLSPKLDLTSLPAKTKPQQLTGRGLSNTCGSTQEYSRSIPPQGLSNFGTRRVGHTDSWSICHTEGFVSICAVYGEKLAVALYLSTFESQVLLAGALPRIWGFQGKLSNKSGKKWASIGNFRDGLTERSKNK